MAEVRVVRAGDRATALPATPGMHRQAAFEHDGVWAGTVTTEAGLLTGWHVHPGHDTYIYIESGAAVVEYGPGGRRGDEAGPGDFVLIPRGVVHREGTAAGSSGVKAVLVRVGEGPIIENREGPDPEVADHA
jgi:uncharacterized RmlC-like cupin family protein